MGKSRLLKGLRVLDLTDEKGYFCGEILADLGAEVIKIERPGGDPGRRRPPFLSNHPDPQLSLHWFAFNAGKKAITLDLERERGRGCFKRMVEGADFVIESYAPGCMESLGLGYAELEKINPGIICVSITLYGHKGPYRGHRGSDISIMGMSGLMSLVGYRDKAPVRLCLDQSYCLGGTQGAIGALLALYHRNFSGLGQHVDVSIYECAVLANYREPLMWDWEKRIAVREGDRLFRGKGTTRQVWECKDGYVTWTLIDNPRVLRALVECMDKEDMAGSLKTRDWDKTNIAAGLSTQEIKSIEEEIAPFFLKHSKQDLEKLSAEKNLGLAGVHDIDEIIGWEHLVRRGFWHREYAYGDNVAIKAPAFPFLSGGEASEDRMQVPGIGEHNNLVYSSELGMREEDLMELKKENII